NQYADLAEWLNDVLESQDTREGREYWDRQQFVSPDVHLPQEKAEDAAPEPFTPRRFPFSLDERLLQTMDQLLGEWGVSRQALFLACWQVLLWQLLAQNEVAIGYTSSHRKYRELQEAIGPFSKCLPV